MGLRADLNLQGNEFSNAATWFFIAFLIAEVPNGTILTTFVPCRALTERLSYHSSTCPRGQMAGSQCDSVGHCDRLYSSSTQLCDSSYRAYLPRNLRSCHCAMLDPHQQPMVHQIRGSSQIQHLVRWSGLGTDHWRRRLLWLPASPESILRRMEDHVHCPGLSHRHHWFCDFLRPPRHSNAGPLPVRDGEGDASEACIRQPDRYSQQEIQPQTGARGPHGLPAVVDDHPDHPGKSTAERFRAVSVALTLTQISISSGVITTYSVTLVRNFGYTPSQSALLNMPSGLVSIASTLIVGYGVRHTSNRWAWLVACCVPGILGGGLMSFATGRKASQLAGIYLVNVITATLIIIYQWTGSNVAGQTKRVISVALVSGSFSVGNIIGPQTFQARDAPDYIPAKITVLATQSAAALVAFVLFLYYVWSNKSKKSTSSYGESVGAEDGRDEQLWEDRTDKQNPTFRYVY